MRVVAVKPEEARADAMLFRTRALLVRQRTQAGGSLRGHPAGSGVVARGVAGVVKLRQEPEAAVPLPEQAAGMAGLL